MMTDIRNLQAFALYIQKTDVKFDLYSVTKEMETQVPFFFSISVLIVVSSKIKLDCILRKLKDLC